MQPIQAFRTEDEPGNDKYDRRGDRRAVQTSRQRGVDEENGSDDDHARAGHDDSLTRPSLPTRRTQPLAAYHSHWAVCGDGFAVGWISRAAPLQVRGLPQCIEGRDVTSTERSRYCDVCGSPVGAGATVCRNCGAALDVSGPVRGQNAPDTAGGDATGGATREGGDTGDDDRGTSSRTRWLVAALVVLAIVLVGVIVALAVSGDDDGTNTPTTTTSPPNTAAVTTTIAAPTTTIAAPTTTAAAPTTTIPPT